MLNPETTSKCLLERDSPFDRQDGPSKPLRRVSSITRGTYHHLFTEPLIRPEP